ncbi:MAG: hypothetical protein AB7R55_23445 [Gemmatimonadales bacterium]
MGAPHHPTPLAADDAALAPPPDEQNPALIDARKTFVASMIGIALFTAAVVAFIL